MSEEQPLTEEQAQKVMKANLRELEMGVSTLGYIHDNGDLCRDGQRAVNGLLDLTWKLVTAIEKDGEVDEIADKIQEANANT